MTIRNELLALKKRADDKGKLLDAHDVLDWIEKHPSSALHRARVFHWDDDFRAAYEHRLEVVRKLISIYVRDEYREPLVISLISDRVRGGGYRDIQEVMSHDDMRHEALKQALNDLRRVWDKYKYLQELAGIGDAIDDAQSGLFNDDGVSNIPVAAKGRRS